MFFCFKRFIFLLIFIPQIIHAQNIAQAVIRMEVTSINEIGCDGEESILLIVYDAFSGHHPTPAYTATTTYALTTNEINKCITVQIDNPMPPFTMLKVAAEAPIGAISAGKVVLTNVAVDLVTNIQPVAQSGLILDYEFTASEDAGPIPLFQRIVTYTLTTEP